MSRRTACGLSTTEFGDENDRQIGSESAVAFFETFEFVHSMAGIARAASPPTLGGEQVQDERGGHARAGIRAPPDLGRPAATPRLLPGAGGPACVVPKPAGKVAGLGTGADRGTLDASEVLCQSGRDPPALHVVEADENDFIEIEVDVVVGQGELNAREPLADQPACRWRDAETGSIAGDIELADGVPGPVVAPLMVAAPVLPEYAGRLTAGVAAAIKLACLGLGWRRGGVHCRPNAIEYLAATDVTRSNITPFGPSLESPFSRTSPRSSSALARCRERADAHARHAGRPRSARRRPQRSEASRPQPPPPRR